MASVSMWHGLKENRPCPIPSSPRHIFVLHVFARFQPLRLHQHKVNGYSSISECPVDGPDPDNHPSHKLISEFGRGKTVSIMESVGQRIAN